MYAFALILMPHEMLGKQNVVGVLYGGYFRTHRFNLNMGNYQEYIRILMLIGILSDLL
jgi:hypothetical protein